MPQECQLCGLHQRSPCCLNLIELGRWKLSAQMVQMVVFFFFFFLSPFPTVFSSPAERGKPEFRLWFSLFKVSDWFQVISSMESSIRNGYRSYQAVIILLLTLLFPFSSPPFPLIFEDARLCFQNVYCVLCLVLCAFFSKNAVFIPLIPRIAIAYHFSW